MEGRTEEKEGRRRRKDRGGGRGRLGKSKWVEEGRRKGKEVR